MKISFPRKNGFDSSLITFLAFSAGFIIWGEIIFPQPLQKADSDAKGRTTIFRRGYTIERNKIHHRKRFNTPNNRTLKPRKMNSSISFKSKQLLKQNAAKKKSQPPNTPQERETERLHLFINNRRKVATRTRRNQKLEIRDRT